MLFRVTLRAAGVIWLDRDYGSYAEADIAIHQLAEENPGLDWEYTITPRREL